MKDMKSTDGDLHHRGHREHRDRGGEEIALLAQSHGAQTPQGKTSSSVSSVLSVVEKGFGLRARGRRGKRSIQRSLAHRSGLCIACLALCAVTFAGPAGAVDYHVSPQGDDTWSGALANANAAATDGPFATLARARDEIRKLKAEGTLTEPVNVLIGEGNYELPHTLTLGAEDSGTADAPIVYRAYRKEKPTVVGGKTVTGWQPHKGEIVMADVEAQGFKDITFRQLFFDGKRQILAR
ncbi:MAG: hypothetical protein HON70_32970, partial [Lentisphaerae bacterium]|nr:hypothetical protein [Lentisphaerota bacterium]